MVNLSQVKSRRALVRDVNFDRCDLANRMQLNCASPGS